MSARIPEEPALAPPVRPPHLSPRAKLSIGLLLTLVGLFVLGGTFPSQPGPLERAVAVTGVGIVTLWLGGVFLGRGGRH